MRIYDKIYKCGCMESLDGGGGLIPCFSEYEPVEKCYFREVWQDGSKVTKEEIQKMNKETRRRNSSDWYE